MLASVVVTELEPSAEVDTVPFRPKDSPMSLSCWSEDAMISEVQRRSTSNNDSDVQQRPTTISDAQRQLMTINDDQQHSATINDNQRRLNDWS